MKDLAPIAVRNADATPWRGPPIPATAEKSSPNL